MKIIYLRLGLFILLLSSVVLFAMSRGKNKTTQEKPKDLIENYNYIIGTQTVGSKYKFTEESMLVETAKQMKAMGSNLLKFSMNPRYCTENYGLPKNEEINSLTKLATLEPSVKAVLDMDFTYYHIWAYGFSQYTDEPAGKKVDTMQIKFIGGYPDAYAEAMYREMYDLAVQLLKTYSNTGKVFFLGHWEGDWHLRWHYDRTKAVDEATLKGMIKWEKVRQQAIDDAKRNTDYTGVEIYNYIEVNLVKVALDQGKTVVANSVVKEVNPDYVSYSAYDGTNPYKTEADLKENLHASLDYIESFLQPKKGLKPGRRVWIGEYGTPAIKSGEDKQNERSKWTIKAGLEWGAPFILYWEMYNNEIQKETGEQVGYWLINDKGEKQAIWHTHDDFYEEAKAFLKSYYKEHQAMPSLKVFQEAAVSFKALENDASFK
jgi:hypothetical protein